MSVAAVIFDMDGILIDSEEVWDQVRRRYAADHDRDWTDTATRDMQGMSSHEWSTYMSEALRIPKPAEQINAEVLSAVLDAYGSNPPVIPGAADAVVRVAQHWPIGLASSSNRELIDQVLQTTGLGEYFSATVSTEEVARGKPAPDGYLAACAELDVDPASSAAVEDSTNGLRSAHSAGMHVIAIPNRAFPPDPQVLTECADIVLHDISQLDVETITALPLPPK